MISSGGEGEKLEVQKVDLSYKAGFSPHIFVELSSMYTCVVRNMRIFLSPHISFRPLCFLIFSLNLFRKMFSKVHLFWKMFFEISLYTHLNI
jgi:hypothetical protein